ncbi:HNH endonuclease [Limosilactobacillus reuteri]|nr:HNH endonuclease [Limosilactobacillus reuteri]UCN18389.1 HNH endonuclease [Limosilactobacillus reuteri]UCN20158.1 HNH endonuclease [Limosilactobacillus reuteri]
MHPLCVNCEAHGIYRKGDLVDHIIELRDDWSKRLDTDNLQTLCYACHNRKTRQAKHRRQQHERQME